MYFIGRLYIQSHWINHFEVFFWIKVQWFSQFPLALISQMTSWTRVKISFVWYKNAHKGPDFNKVLFSLVSCLSHWPQWLFQNLCIPPTSSSLCSSPSDSLAQWEDTSHQRFWVFQLSTIKSKHVYASESPDFFFPLHKGAEQPLRLLGWVSLLPPLPEPVLLVLSSPHIYAASHWLLHQTGSSLNQTFLKPSLYSFSPSSHFCEEADVTSIALWSLANFSHTTPHFASAFASFCALNVLSCPTTPLFLPKLLHIIFSVSTSTSLL